MTVFALIFFSVYAVVLLLGIRLGTIYQYRKQRKFQGEGTLMTLDKVTVIVPFRNEAHRIVNLLEAFNAQDQLPYSILFVDDHSSDTTVEVIRATLTMENFSVLSLPPGVEGKKRAILHAIQSVETDFVITLDADVQIQPDYFTGIAGLKQADMYILPVVMKPKTFVQSLFEFDHVLASIVNVSVAGWKRPILASGANLAFRTADFKSVESVESHAHKASGDDMYLLRDFRIHSKTVQLTTEATLTATTEAPASFKEFVHQRLRWMQKTGDVNDALGTRVAILQALFTLLFVTGCLLEIMFGNWMGVTVWFGIKWLIDFLALAPSLLMMHKRGLIALLPLYEFLYPIYMLMLLVLAPFFTPTWKGRKV